MSSLHSFPVFINYHFLYYFRYHRQWPEVIRKRYLESNPKLLQHIHRSLVDYFTGRWTAGKPYKDKQDNTIKVDNRSILSSSFHSPFASLFCVSTTNCLSRLVDPQPLYLAGNIPNVRRLSELPYPDLLESLICSPLFISFFMCVCSPLTHTRYHQLHCGSFTEMAENSLGYLPFISAKIEANKLFELIEDYILVCTLPFISLICLLYFFLI